MSKVKFIPFVNNYKNQIEVCVRGIVMNAGKILVCWNKEKKYYFFPGGHVDFGERVDAALKRELKEELNMPIKRASFIGVKENIYNDKKEKHHEINFVFTVSANKVMNKSNEDHIDFVFMDREKFINSKVLPIVIQKEVIKQYSALLAESKVQF